MQRCHQTTLSQDTGNWMDHMMKVSEGVVFITGANRGLGLAIAREARRQGAKKIYVGMRQIGVNKTHMHPHDLNIKLRQPLTT